MNNWSNEILKHPKNKEPKEIFEAYCGELGKYYENQNFKYFKSRPRIEKQISDIVQTINFWSSRVNVKNEHVHLEILPHVKSKSLKKWIKTNEIGRNEFLFSLKIDYPRNIDILNHSFGDFKKLSQDIDQKILSKLNEFVIMTLDLRKFLQTDEFDSGLIEDNFMAYLCMKDSKLIGEALEKYGDKLNENTKLKIEKFNTN